MRISDKYMLLQNGDDYLAVSLNSRMIVKLNDVGAFIWEQFKKDTTVENVSELTAEYFRVAYSDAFNIVNKFISYAHHSGLLINSTGKE